MKQRLLDQYFLVLIFLTMRTSPTSLAALPGLCSLVVCLCVLSQTCDGNHSSPKPVQYPGPSLAEGTGLSTSHVNKLTSPSNRSEASVRNRTFWEPRSQRNQNRSKEMDQDSQHLSKRGWIWNQFFVLEEHLGPEPQYVGKLHSNSDKGDGSARYILSGEGANSIFVIDQMTGDIHAAKSLDRETKSQYVLHASAVDWRTNQTLEAESEFIIKVQDVNDNAPSFREEPFTATVPEMSDIGTSVFQVTADDADDPTYGNSATIVYTLLDGTPYFSVDPKSGIIRIAMSNMDRESRDHYLVVLQAKDMAGSVGGLSGSTTVSITLTDVNDQPPKFQQRSYQLYVPEVAAVGGEVGRVSASDEDEGRNAAMTYRITNADAASLFAITTDEEQRRGIISLKKRLDYERRKVHIVHVEASNVNVDSRFSHLGPFKDSTTVRVLVGDVDEPPVFSTDHYLMDVYENSAIGTRVGAVTAVDPDGTSSTVRYSINSEEGNKVCFTVGLHSGVIRTSQVLDREEAGWHNVTVTSAEVDNPGMVSHVSVTVRVLDVNDHAPVLAAASALPVCEDTDSGQVIETLRATDLDGLANGGLSFYFAAEHPAEPRVTLRDNGDDSVSIVWVQPGRSGRGSPSLLLVVLVVADGGRPSLSSTATLSLSVCACQRAAARECRPRAFLSPQGVSLGASVAIVLCLLILLSVAMLIPQLQKNKASKEPLMVSAGDVRENVVTYDDEGGGEEDTEAFDLLALQKPQAPDRKLQSDLRREDDAMKRRSRGRGGTAEDLDSRDYSPEREAVWFILDRVPRQTGRSATPLLFDGHHVVGNILQTKVTEADSDTRGPPYDSLHTYAYEGLGSLASSISSLDLSAAELGSCGANGWNLDL